MPAQYAHLDGRRYVNADFVSKVRETYPVTTKKIPLGYSTYTGWAGKDEVLFTEHQPLDDLAHLAGQLYEVTFDPSNPDAFEQDILGRVSHSTIEKRSSSEGAPRARRRLSDDCSLERRWGGTLAEAGGRRLLASRRGAVHERKAARAERLRAYLAKLKSTAAPATVDEWLAWDPSG